MRKRFSAWGWSFSLGLTYQVHWETMTAAVRPVLTDRPAVLNCSEVFLMSCSDAKATHSKNRKQTPHAN